MFIRKNIETMLLQEYNHIHMDNGHCLKICKMSKYVKHDNTQEYK